MDELSKQDKHLIKEAKTNGFLRSNKINTYLRNSYFEYCKSENCPKILITDKTKYSLLSIDFITTNFNFSDDAVEKISSLSINYLHNSSINSFGNIYCEFSKVYINKVEAFVFELKSIFANSKFLEKITK